MLVREEYNMIYLDEVKRLADKYEFFRTMLCVRTSDHYLDVFYGEGYDFLYEKEDITVEAGATKMVIIAENSDHVIKIPFLEKATNYCENEVETYRDLEGNFVDYFAETWKIGEITIDDKVIPLYAMEKVEVDEEKVEEESYKYYLDNGGEEGEYCPYDSLEEVFNCFSLHYGYELAGEIVEFLDEYGINDIHTANIGYKNGRPVIIDYSGFYG